MNSFRAVFGYVNLLADNFHWVIVILRSNNQAWQRITSLLGSRQATGLTKYSCVLHRRVIPFGLLPQPPDPKMTGALSNR